MRAIPIGLVLSLILTSTLTFTAACGGAAGGTPSGNSGVTETKVLSSLTPAEVGQLCDWGASLYGGYGKTLTCADGSTSNSEASQAVCVAGTIYKTCAATVAQLEACAHKIHDLCLSALGTAECQPLLPCLT